MEKIEIENFEAWSEIKVVDQNENIKYYINKKIKIDLLVKNLTKEKTIHTKIKNNKEVKNGK